MINIVIQINKRNKKTFLFAENWNEIDNKQFRKYFYYFISMYNINTDKSLKEEDKLNIIKDLRYKLIPACCNLPKKILLKLEDYQIKSLYNLTSFLLDDNDLYKIIIRKFNHRITNYYAPKDNFNNLTFGEFIYADTYFINYYNLKDNSFLNKLIAVLYRVKNSNGTSSGDIRKPFNEHIIERQFQSFNKISNNIKQIILFNYSTIRTHITELYPEVFGSGKSSSTSETPATIKGWDDFIKSISSNVFEIKQYSEENLHNVLSYLNSKLISNKK